MSKRKPLIFSKSCLAVAVVALSACSSNPTIQDDSAIGAVGDTLSRAGVKTRDLSISAWDKTVYLLGFSDVNPDAALGDDKANNQLLDEVDLAILERDAVLPPDFFKPARDIVVVTSPDGLQTPTTFPVPLQTPTITTAEFDASGEPNPIQKEGGIFGDINSASIAEATSIIPEASNLTADDGTSDSQYFHEVASSQTLWDIAKSTTGDANNWHTIADVNDLTQSTSVYPGQRLLIPSDLLKPKLLAANSDIDTKTPTHNSSSDTPVAAANADGAASTLTSAAAESEANMGVSDATLAAEAPRLKIPAVDSATAELELAASNEDLVQDSVQLALSEGESLWEFARRATGDATNWQSIATHNGMDEAAARLVFPGQMITVPSSMLRTDEPTSAAPTAANDPTLNTSSDVASASQSTTSTGDTFPSELSEATPERIIEATYQAEPTTVTETALTDSSVLTELATNAPSRGEVIVSGTYYPKAVYHDTDFSAPLLMRVSPGTRLQVSQTDGPWLQVETEKGTGYLHQRDIR